MQQERRTSDMEYKADMHQRVASLEADLSALSDKVDEVLDLLRASKLATKFISILGAAGLTLLTAWATFKGIK